MNRFRDFPIAVSIRFRCWQAFIAREQTRALGERTRPRVHQPAPSPVGSDARDQPREFNRPVGGKGAREGADHRRRGARFPRILNRSAGHLLFATRVPAWQSRNHVWPTDEVTGAEPENTFFPFSLSLSPGERSPRTGACIASRNRNGGTPRPRPMGATQAPLGETRPTSSPCSHRQVHGKQTPPKSGRESRP